ncbi:ribosome maturation protein RimP [Stakelama sp. CBK3Z-3]|uniref:Ribosome maturation factor RimP n=1 Tax=Stakelama flava TaxID=2860338 RepID=A0ABS6XIX2_9SPHN|nr:ribosome maturation protein RimP [Stakelama flava]MBW4330158.1 ribosome maturation protein RimP [Stakelama flava]
MTDIARLTALIEPEASALGFDLVRVTMFGSESDSTLQVMAERPETGQLTIDDCAALSRRVSDMLDALEAEGRDPIDHAYRLEVSSPGIDRPLTRLKDYEAWQGHDARITLAEKRDGRRAFKGVLAGVENGAVKITDADGGEHLLPLSDIGDAKLVMTDRLIAAAQPLSMEGADEFIEEGQD